MSDQDDELVPSTRVLQPIWMQLSTYQQMLEERVDYHRGRAAFWEHLYWFSTAINVGAFVAILLLVK